MPSKYAKAFSSPNILLIVGRAIAIEAREGIPAAVTGSVHGYNARAPH